MNDKKPNKNIEENINIFELGAIAECMRKMTEEEAELHRELIFRYTVLNIVFSFLDSMMGMHGFTKEEVEALNHMIDVFKDSGAECVNLLRLD